MVAIATAALAVAAALLAPPAQAMQVGNYDVLTNRYDRASWFWFVSPCEPEGSPDCLDIDGTPRLQFYAYYGGTARLANGRWPGPSTPFTTWAVSMARPGRSSGRSRYGGCDFSARADGESHKSLPDSAILRLLVDC
jgi:hypothetical protein